MLCDIYSDFNHVFFFTDDEDDDEIYDSSVNVGTQTTFTG